MNPKICITTLEYPPDIGGVGESVYRISRLLCELGYDVHVAVFHSKQRKFVSELPQKSTIQSTCQDGISVHRLYPPVRSNEPIMQDFLSDIYLQLKQLHRQHQFEMFHAFFVNETGFITTLLAREENVPVINSIRGSDLHKHVFNAKLHGQTVWVLEQSDWVTAVSHDLLRRARVLAPSIQTKSSAFWNSIAPIDFSALSTPQTIQQVRGTTIGSVGRFRDKKGIEYLLDACAQIEQDITLLLVGDFAERERDYWQQAIAASGIADRIVVTGLVDRATALSYLTHIDIVAIPSLHDGCPNAMLEAMLAGRAIVGTRVDAIGDILEDEIDALLVSPASADELAIALRQLIHQPSLRQRLGQAAQQKALRQLAPAVEQRNWQTVYKQVLGTQEFTPLIRTGSTL